MKNQLSVQASLTPTGRFYLRYGKRAFDLALAVPSIMVLSPLLLLLSVLVRLNLGAPILFRQERVGVDEEIFRLHKFRSMSNARDAAGRLLPDGDRLSPFGLFLRRWSLDELPQLLNVITGELSLVGPRPLLVRYLPRYTPRQRRRHLVRPGITGLAQVSGRNLLSWDERFELDLRYVKHCDLMLDLWILCRTVTEFFGSDTPFATGGKALEEFWGCEGPPMGGPRAFPAEETAGGR